MPFYIAFLPPVRGVQPLKVVVPWNVFMVHIVFFGLLILTQIINTVAIRCQILRLKSTKFDCGWGSAQGRSQDFISEGVCKLGGGDRRGPKGRSPRPERPRATYLSNLTTFSQCCYFLNIQVMLRWLHCPLLNLAVLENVAIANALQL